MVCWLQTCLVDAAGVSWVLADVVHDSCIGQGTLPVSGHTRLWQCLPKTMQFCCKASRHRARQATCEYNKGALSYQ